MEILEIRRENVNLKQRTIYIPNAKGEHVSSLPITRQLTEFLEGYMTGLQKGTPWLFPSPSAKEGHNDGYSQTVSPCSFRRRNGS
jgi:hypothetical protein